MQFIRENLRYPEAAIKKSIEGRVTVQFVVWKDGSVRNIEILKPHPKLLILEQEAMRVVRLMGTQGLWTPAVQKGKNVPVRFRMPFEFQL
jgi:TonB family protein